MDVNALFDKLAVDLAEQGVTSGEEGGHRVLLAGGVPFARLAGDVMSFRAPEGSQTEAAAEALQTSEPLDGPWQAVPAEDVSQWESLARSALASLGTATSAAPAVGSTGGGEDW